MQNIITNINSSEFENEVLESKIPVLVDFWAPWCAPCRMMSPVLEELSELGNGKFKIVKVNIEEITNQPLAQKYEVFSIPNLKLFKDGVVLNEYIGVVDSKTLFRSIEKQV